MRADTYAAMSTDQGRAGDEFFSVAVASAVHELRAPLSVMTGFADLIQQRWDEADRAELKAMVSVLARNAERMNRLVEELLAVAQAQREVTVLEAGEVDALSLLNTAAQAAVAHGVPVEIRCPSDLWLQTEVHRAEQILASLVDNARRHGRPPIVLTAATAADGISITVRDAGPSIAAERIPQLFEPFTPAATSQKGTHGLGLYTARCSARRLHGDLNYVSEESGGAFVLTLPGTITLL